MKNKYENLKKYLKELKSVVVAFSAGADSCFLLKIAKDVLDKNVIAVTISSSFFPKRELNEAVAFCKKENIKHIIVEIDEKDIEKFSENPLDRCYFCKKHLFNKIKEVAAKEGFKNVIEGSNVDDTLDYRPGMKAVEELKILSPLKLFSLTKKEIRLLSKELNLNYNKSSFACLASRFAFGENITKQKLEMVEKAENVLFELGFRQFRVRIQNKSARIEILEDEFEKLIKKDIRKKIIKEFYEYGFMYVSMDLEGYKTGNMNKILDIKD